MARSGIWKELITKLLIHITRRAVISARLEPVVDERTSWLRHVTAKGHFEPQTPLLETHCITVDPKFGRWAESSDAASSINTAEGLLQLSQVWVV